MLALETTASINGHRLVIQDAALPAHAERARVIVNVGIDQASRTPLAAASARRHGRRKRRHHQRPAGKRLGSIILMLILDTRAPYVTRSIAERAVSLPEHHKDPADRIIIASAIEYKAQLLSVDGRFPDYQELAGLLVQD